MCELDGSFVWQPILQKMVQSRDLLPQIEEEHQSCRSFWNDAKGWRGCNWSRKLKNQFEKALTECSAPAITQVICMGVGGFAYHFALGDSEFTGRSSYHQLCALEFFIELLSLHQNKPFDTKKVYFQDPLFIDVDEKFLRSKGFSIIREPQAVNVMTLTTFLYAPRLPRDELCKALAVEYPALHMGNLLEKSLEKE